MPLEADPDEVRDGTPAGLGGYYGRVHVTGLLLDLDGTLYVGNEPVEGASEAVERLQASGLALRYVTNTTRKPRRAVREHLRSLGFEVIEENTLGRREGGGVRSWFMVRESRYSPSAEPATARGA